MRGHRGILNDINEATDAQRESRRLDEEAELSRLQRGREALEAERAIRNANKVSDMVEKRQRDRDERSRAELEAWEEAGRWREKARRRDQEIELEERRRKVTPPTTPEGVLRDVLPLESESQDPAFISHLVKTQDLKVEREGDGSELSYYGRGEDGARPHRRFKIVYNKMEDPENVSIATSDIRTYYDEWREERMRNRVKKGGIATTIVLSVVGLVTGLSLGLRRGGADLKMKAKEITPAEKKKEVIPWSDIEEAAGEGVTFIGDHVAPLAGLALYLSLRRR